MPLTKNQHTPSKKFFWVQATWLAVSFQTLTRSVALTGTEKFLHKATCVSLFFSQKSPKAAGCQSVKAGCYMGKILLNDLMFADDFVFCLCVLTRCTWVANYTRCVSGLCMKLFSTEAKLFVWRLRLRRQKARSSCCWQPYYQLQIFGECTGYWAFRWQKHSETTVTSEASFSQCSNTLN